MGYIVRLSDGRFVVIDGGMAEYDEIEHFFETLNSQNELESVPVIALWFITHPHFDHFNFFVKSVAFTGKLVIPVMVLLPFTLYAELLTLGVATVVPPLLPPPLLPPPVLPAA